jgi:AcrR family transcriptional regulator
MSKSPRRSRKSGPIWTRPAPGTRRPRFSREEIAAAALALADKDGLEAVTMRRIALRIGAGTMTLYHYLRTREDLLALMDDAIMAEVVVPGELPRGWRAALTAIARRTRDAFLRHPWALYSLQGARMGPNGMRHVEQTMVAVAGAPLDVAGQMELAFQIDDFVFGHALRLGESRPGSREITRFLKEQLATGLYPRMQELMGGGDLGKALERVNATVDDEGRFQRGLDALFDAAERGPRRSSRRKD